MNKNQIRLYIQWITQHAKLNNRLHQMRLTDDPTCRFCNNDVESSYHVMFQCPYTEQERVQFQIKMTRERILNPLVKIEGKWNWEASRVSRILIELLFMIHDRVKKRLEKDEKDWIDSQKE